MRLAYDTDHVILRVTDDGVGFDAEGAGTKTGSAGFGLYGMRQRASHLGGDISIESRLGQGTVIEARLSAAPYTESEN